MQLEQERLSLQTQIEKLDQYHEGAQKIAELWKDLPAHAIAEIVLTTSNRTRTDANFKRLITTIFSYLKDMK